jgi:hypothetical protein
MADSSDQFRSLQVGSMDALNELEQDSKANRGTPMTADYAWQELYQAAILETDDGKLADCLPLVKTAIEARLRELQMDHQGTLEERQAIRDALNGLDGLQRELEKTRSHEMGLSKV